ncbi:MerC mercury resistance protein [Sphingobium lactosutens]|nr:MerC mercury resistance protein [Sphingobium lactosutens]
MISFDEDQPAASGQKSANQWLDGFALCASSLCTLHCLGLPLLFALLPAFASRIDPGESFHGIMLALAAPTSLFALLQGWRVHGWRRPLWLGLSGLILMSVGALLVEGALNEVAWTVAGSTLLALANILNWRRSRAGHQPST